MLAQALRLASDLDSLTRGVRGDAPLALEDAVKALRAKSSTWYNPDLLDAFLVMLRLDGVGRTVGATLGALKLKRLKSTQGGSR